jgi:hypothetical protein
MGDSNQPIEDLDAWEALEPAPDFADRVLARIQGEFVTGSHPAQLRNQVPVTSTDKSIVEPARRVGRTLLIAGGAAAVSAIAVAAVMLLWLRSSDSDSKRNAANQVSSGRHGAMLLRSTEKVGERAIAVVEPNGVLSWNVTPNGSGAVTQDRGSVFYRVEHSDVAGFVVNTVHGRVTVTGTCFTVDVSRDATNVTVHEGSVAVNTATDTAALVAGEGVYFSGGRIHQRLVSTESTSGNRTNSSLPKQPAASMANPVVTAAPKRFNQDSVTLKQWAQTCKVVADMPPFDAEKPADLTGWARYANSLGATPQEVMSVKESYEKIESDAASLLNTAYETFTGNKSSPDMTMDEAIFEIVRTGGYLDPFETYQAISQERAGLKEAPAKDAKLGPVEYLLRKILAQGDLFEAELAKRLGPARARALRETNEGWPGQGSEWEGCPPAK